MEGIDGPWRHGGVRWVVDATDSPVCMVQGDGSDPAVEAKARLIVQAPAMATKLEATHQYLREQGHDEMADEIEALLTAIKGE